MKKFVLLHYGFVTPTKEIGEAWGKWFESIGDKMVDSGLPFSYGKEIARDGTVTEHPLSPDSITGYTIINADSFDEAEAIARTCPSIKSIRVYDTAPM